MSRFEKILGVCFFAIAVGYSSTSFAATTSPEDAPNIIFILCDDLGWGDLGILYQNESSHPKKLVTPAIDAMAREGAQLRNHYCPAPVCAPSRASLLLGVHQGHSDVRDNQFDKALPNNHTIASVLKSAGYTTAIIGKYGLQGGTKNESTSSSTPAARWPAYPTERGFDEFFGYVRHVDGHLHYPAESWPLGNSPTHQTPKEVWHNDREVSQQLDRCYTTDLFTAYAKKWIVDQSKQDVASPFFLYLAYDTPHAALQVPTMEYPSGRGVNGGIQWTGKDGEMINTAKGTIDSYRNPKYTDKGWSDVEERFATMVTRIDDCVGDLLQTLRDLEIDKNTLVVLSSDNGPHHEAYLQSAQYAPTSFQSYGPFDGTKRDTWEGGIRVPTVAWWPSHIPAGTIDTTPSQFHDWMATMADVAGTQPPAICDGVSLLNSMTGKGDRRESSVYVEYSVGGSTQRYADFEQRKQNKKRGQMQVIMHRGYKGVRVNITDPNKPFEIYDLENDPSETKNLAGTSAKFEKLQQGMQERVLRMRRANESAKRPYDKLPVPALPEQPMTPGIMLSGFKGTFPYVPQMLSLPASETINMIMKDISNDPEGLDEGVYQYIGHLNIPAEGEYRFELQSATPSLARIHDAILIDNDFDHDASKTRSTQIRLAAGTHRFTITLLAGQTSSKWRLSCYRKGDSSTDLADGGWLIPKATDESSR
ncbi:sulfatase-like hydrolase/transferase [Aporhodopirellula aestuarii]|uniref:Sulfatase-like hydrolase/transferase n=1 Tax=Aporhodopirellula aestuarii TaxID=2950107 RepID=A0ABT0U3W4_9BACT|nr:sulfatase-like hydrolase/transferase [Aporhodopirellula aestuarii]MCM2371611.1 sulfatase-like hydrolase/transferase [Aporhodopirellula aestuarii]